MAATKTILVLDDDPSLRHMLQAMLEQDGYSVVAVGDVQSALAQCSAQLPDMMIVDLMLPVQDGEMFLHEFRRRFREAEVPAIVLSASSARSEIAQRLAVHASLPKPFFAEDLKELVHRLANGDGSVRAI